MCESEPVILSAINFLLTIIILLLLYLLSLKICLWELTKLIQFFARQNHSSISKNSQELRDTPFSWTVKITELGIYFAEEPHRLRSWISLRLTLEL